MILLTKLNDDQIIKVSNANQHPLKNINAVKKNIKAKYLLKERVYIEKLLMLREKMQVMQISYLNQI